MFSPELLSVPNLSNFTQEKYHILVAELAKIDRSTVENELTELPSTFSYYHGLMIAAKRNLDESRIIQNTWEASFRDNERTEKKWAVAALEDRCVSQKEYMELAENVLRNDLIYGLVRSICQTLDHKKDMLVQLSANIRQETKLYA